jgi:Tfp pilus assembly protein PilV
MVTVRLRGFTFPEAIVTMAILVLFAGLTGVLFFQGTSMAARVNADSRAVQDQAFLVSVLPRICEQVRSPEWGQDEATFQSAANGALTVGYWKGVPDQKVVFSAHDGALQIVTPETTWELSLVASQVAWWKVEDRIVGVLVTWQNSAGKQTLHVLWGAHAL